MRCIRVSRVDVAVLVLIILLGAVPAFALRFDQEKFIIVSPPRGPNGQFSGRWYGGEVIGRFEDGQLQIICLQRASRSLNFNRQADGGFAGWVRRNADEVSRHLFPSGPE